MNLWTSVFLILGALFAFTIKIFPVLANHPWLKLLFISIVISALISRLFFMKDGFILEIKNAVPRITGRRKENSKLEKYFRFFEGIGIALCVTTLFILFFEGETIRLRQQFGVVS
ncbi:hypothetical protein SAMN05216325_103211 [Nitrosomonas marina]|uniref:DUF3899 domain-containing protein n=2 Tax=Nitrosomonas marina TaxID=917 RepID=A0A1H8C2G7_9PROT|nr:hypothetical protein SAMN05216325_103211 [Nitrosomonas marina]